MREQYLQKALKDVPEDAYKILLAHHSIFIDEAFKHNINFDFNRSYTWRTICFFR